MNNLDFFDFGQPSQQTYEIFNSTMCPSLQRQLKTLTDDQSMIAKLEKSRQSARECRARKKLRYQYLDDMIAERERANLYLKEELQKYVSWCQQLDGNQIPDGLQSFLNSDMYKDGKM